MNGTDGRRGSRCAVPAPSTACRRSLSPSTLGRQTEMTWQDDHEKRVAALPADVREAHKRSIRHRAEIIASNLCGCFYCLSTFAPSEIAEWTDDGDTALCP